MKLNLWFMIAAVVALIFGLGFLLIPDQVLSWYGVTGSTALSDAGVLMTRLFGATLIGFGALDWFAKDVEESDARRSIVIGGFVSTAIGFVVFLIAQLGNVVNSLGWVNVVIYLLLAAGFGYFLSPMAASTAMKPGTSQ